MNWTEQNISDGKKTYVSHICETDNKLFTATILKKTNTVWFLSIKYIKGTESYVIYESLITVKAKEEIISYAEAELTIFNNCLTRFFSNYGIRSTLENGHLILPCPICFKQPAKKMIKEEFVLVCEQDGKKHCESIGKTNVMAVSRWNFYVGSIVDQIMEQERQNHKLAKAVKKELKENTNA